jgi:hypothetical protein
MDSCIRRNLPAAFLLSLESIRQTSIAVEQHDVEIFPNAPTRFRGGHQRMILLNLNQFSNYKYSFWPDLDDSAHAQLSFCENPLASSILLSRGL